MKIELELKPFTVPASVVVIMPHNYDRDVVTIVPYISLKDLQPDALGALCDDFRRDVFEKAGKTDPLAHLDF